MLQFPLNAVQAILIMWLCFETISEWSWDIDKMEVCCRTTEARSGSWSTWQRGDAQNCICPAWRRKGRTVGTQLVAGFCNHRKDGADSFSEVYSERTEANVRISDEMKNENGYMWQQTDQKTYGITALANFQYLTVACVTWSNFISSML